MVIFSVLFLFAYPPSAYVEMRDEMPAGSSQYQGGVLGTRALLSAFNVTDLLKAIWVAPLRLKRGRAMLKAEKVDNSSHVPVKISQEADVVYEDRN